MKKSIAIVLIIIALLLGAGGTFAGFYAYNQSLVTQYEEQVTVLQASIDSIGSIVEAYTVNSQTKAGDMITDEILDVVSIPESMINDSFVTNPEDIVGKYCKVAITPGTPITAGTLMETNIKDDKALYNTIREYDVVVNLWPIGLDVGDFVDMRILMPYGEEYIVLSHMRVDGMSEQTVKFDMTELQINLYQSALVDYYLNSAQGCMIYFTKYIEPGLQKPATITYKVSSEVMQAVRKNPNLYATAWASIYDATTRNEIDADLVDTAAEQQSTEEARTGSISGGRTSWASSISGAASYTNDHSSSEDEDEPKEVAEW